MKITNWILFCAIVAAISFVIYFSREIFYYKYEPEYYENLYYHSQWSIPQSTRGISDGELYKFIGYRLAQGENPFNVNFEVPPFAKYLYGLSEMYLGNPFWVSLGMYGFLLCIFYLFSRFLFKEKGVILSCLFLLVTTPFIATQIKETMLDLPLTAMFLAHVYYFVKYLKEAKTTPLIISGIFLGLATGTKIGVYTPIVGIIGFLLTFVVSKKVKTISPLFYTASVVGGYILSFFCYFIKHPNPIPWLKLHEKPINFYLASGGNTDYLNQWKGIFLNTYKGWWGAGATSLGDWSLILPLGTVLSLLILVIAFRKKDLVWLYICLFTISILFVNSLIPFWPRYLMPVVPLFILMIVYSFKKWSLIIIILALANLPILIPTLTVKNLAGHVDAVMRFSSTRAYRELYRSIDPYQRKDMPENKFIDANEKFFSALDTRLVEVSVSNLTDSGEYGTATFKMVYTTKYGILQRDQKINFKRVDNQWRLSWNWDYVWPGYSQDSRIEITPGTIPLLGIEENGKMIAQRGKWVALYVRPRLMASWNQQLDGIAKVTNQDSMELNKVIRAVVPDKYPVFVGYLDPKLGSAGSEQALAVHGVNIEETQYLIPANGYKDLKHISDILKPITKDHPEYFYLRAKGSIQNKDGGVVVLPFEYPKDKDFLIKL